MAEGAPAKFNVPQRLWRATVEDTVDKIRAWQQAVVTTEVRPKIYTRAGDDKAERKRLLGLAKAGGGVRMRGCHVNVVTRSPASGPSRGGRGG